MQNHILSVSSLVEEINPYNKSIAQYIKCTAPRNSPQLILAIFRIQISQGVKPVLRIFAFFMAAELKHLTQHVSV